MQRKGVEERRGAFTVVIQKRLHGKKQAGQGQEHLVAAYALDARREAMRAGLLNATATAIGNGGIADLGDGQPFPHAITIEGGLSKYVEEPITDEPAVGFSSLPDRQVPINDPDTWAAYCSREAHDEAARLLARR